MRISPLHLSTRLQDDRQAERRAQPHSVGGRRTLSPRAGWTAGTHNQDVIRSRGGTGACRTSGHVCRPDRDNVMPARFEVCRRPRCSDGSGCPGTAGEPDVVVLEDQPRLRSLHAVELIVPFDPPVLWESCSGREWDPQASTCSPRRSRTRERGRGDGQGCQRHMSPVSTTERACSSSTPSTRDPLACRRRQTRPIWVGPPANPARIPPPTSTGRRGKTASPGRPGLRHGRTHSSSRDRSGKRRRRRPGRVWRKEAGEGRLARRASAAADPISPRRRTPIGPFEALLALRSPGRSRYPRYRAHATRDDARAVHRQPPRSVPRPHSLDASPETSSPPPCCSAPATRSAPVGP